MPIILFLPGRVSARVASFRGHPTMTNKSAAIHQTDLTEIFDTIDYPDAYRITYLANAIALPAYEEVKRDFGIIRAEYIILVCLIHYPQLTAQEVARISRRPRNTISRAVNRMLSEGYIVRTPDPDDARQAYLAITPAGKVLESKIAVYLQKRQELVLDGLTAKERYTLSTLLRKAALHAASLYD